MVPFLCCLPRVWLHESETQPNALSFAVNAQDVGIHLITLTDIQRASKLPPNDLEKAIDGFRRCKVRVLGIDWGGGGKEEISFTTVAMVGLDPADGLYKCFYCERLHAGYTHDEEVKRVLYLFREGACHFVAHDYGGSGSVRETLLIQSGFPVNLIINFVYVSASTRNIIYYTPPHRAEMRGFYSLDKARSLVLQATTIKTGMVLLPEYESSKNVTHDLLNLLEDKHKAPGKSDIYLIRKRPKSTDDFAHALNYGLMAIYHTEQSYPDLSSVQGIKMTAEQLRFASPPNPIPLS